MSVIEFLNRTFHKCIDLDDMRVSTKTIAVYIYNQNYLLI